MGGGGSYIGDHDIDALDRIPREKIRESDQPQRRNVFISFAAEDLTLVNFLRGQAKNENSNVNLLLERDPVKISYENGDIKLLADVENSIISKLSNSMSYTPNLFCSNSAYKLLESEGIL